MAALALGSKVASGAVLFGVTIGGALLPYRGGGLGVGLGGGSSSALGWLSKANLFGGGAMLALCLLHLVPHALTGGHSHGDHEHERGDVENSGVWVHLLMSFLGVLTLEKFSESIHPHSHGGGHHHHHGHFHKGELAGGSHARHHKLSDSPAAAATDDVPAGCVAAEAADVVSSVATSSTVIWRSRPSDGKKAPVATEMVAMTANGQPISTAATDSPATTSSSCSSAEGGNASGADDMVNNRSPVDEASEAAVPIATAKGDTFEGSGVGVVVASLTSASWSPYILLVVISCHALFEGIAVGTATTAIRAWVTAAILCGHKFPEAMVLSVAFCKNGIPRNKALPILLSYAAATPFGVALGAVLPGLGLEWLESPLTCVAAGSLLYVACCEIIPEEFTPPTDIFTKVAYYAAGSLLVWSLTQAEHVAQHWA